MQTPRNAIANPVGAAQYFGWHRSDILAHVPAKTRCVLSVGCGAGVTEADLVARGVRVVGIERDANAAAAARNRGLDIINIDANEAPDALGDEVFDCLIFADVLEHLQNPSALLTRLARRLTPKGTAIISVPNFRNCKVLWQLGVLGEIRYQDAGILDRTHLCITTRKMVVGWLNAAGLWPKSSEYRIARRRDRLLSVCLCHLADEFLAEQVIVVGEKV